MARESAHQLAVKALEKIAEHEKDCAMRWGETNASINDMKEHIKSHSTKWDRLTWLIIASIVGFWISTILV